MAKGAKSFQDKLNKKAEAKTKRIRIIRSVKDRDTGGIRFLDNMADVAADGNIDEQIKKHLKEGA